MTGGITEVSGVEFIDRGYENLVFNLSSLGAEVWREMRNKVPNNRQC